MAKKQKKSESPKLNVKGLNKIVQQTNVAHQKAASIVQKALNKAGAGRFTVVTPGKKALTGPAPKFKKRVPGKTRRSPE